jgi:phenylacetic acid degradation operon negative regulatory protein
MLHFAITVINKRTNDPVRLEPLSPRSVVLSVLLGTHPPSMPVGPLLDFTSLFGISDGTARTALSRMTKRGELVNDDGVYRLSGRLLERQAQQDAGRIAPPTTWDGTWWFVAVLADRRSVAERRAFRSTVTGARFGELRPDTWLRPANLDAPADLDGALVTRGPLLAGDDRSLARRLWDLDAIDAHARSLAAALDATSDRLVEDPRDSALADAFVQLAAAQRFLRTEPQLPESLDPGRSSTRLRTTYEAVVTSFQQRLGAFLAERQRERQYRREVS